MKPNKKKSAKKQQKISREKILKGKDEVAAPDEREDDFDFGGLPKIDMKKNLGCG